MNSGIAPRLGATHHPAVCLRPRSSAKLRKMSASREYRNIALVGFMGAGKTTVGSILAHLLQFEFLDTDRLIESRENRKITDLFVTEGEAYFRQKENDLCHELESATGKVISTGGGMIVHPDNLASLRRHALLVCLWASPETIYSRLKHQTHRPLLQTADPLTTIRDLMSRRAPAYKEADVLVGVDFRSPGDTARHIANSYRRLQSQSAAGREATPTGRFPEIPRDIPAANLPCPPPAPSALSPSS